MIYELEVFSFLVQYRKKIGEHEYEATAQRLQKGLAGDGAKLALSQYANIISPYLVTNKIGPWAALGGVLISPEEGSRKEIIENAGTGVMTLLAPEPWNSECDFCYPGYCWISDYYDALSKGEIKECCALIIDCGIDEALALLEEMIPELSGRMDELREAVGIGRSHLTVSLKEEEMVLRMQKDVETVRKPMGIRIVGKRGRDEENGDGEGLVRVRERMQCIKVDTISKIFPYARTYNVCDTFWGWVTLKHLLLVAHDEQLQNESIIIYNEGQCIDKVLRTTASSRSPYVLARRVNSSIHVFEGPNDTECIHRAMESVEDMINGMNGKVVEIDVGNMDLVDAIGMEKELRAYRACIEGNKTMVSRWECCFR